MAMKAKELAQLMGVSAATMSLVLNNKPGISSDLRNTLLHQVRELGYGYMIKGENGNADIEQAHRKIAYLIYPDSESQKGETSFFAPVLEGVEREARRLGYQVMVVHMDGEADELFGQDLHEECQGVVIQAQTIGEEMERQLEMIGLPAVLTACPDGGKRVLSVGIDHESGMQKVVSLLKKCGHTRVAYAGVVDKNDVEKERFRYFQLAMTEAGMMFGGRFDISAGDREEEKLQKELKRTEQENTFPTAIVLEDDLLAPVVYRVLRRAGLRIPEDVSVIGFGGREICSMIDPSLSTVRVPRRYMGRMVMTMLDHRIDMHSRGMENAGVRMKVDVELVEMESVGLAAE